MSTDVAAIIVSLRRKFIAVQLRFIDIIPKPLIVFEQSTLMLAFFKFQGYKWFGTKNKMKKDSLKDCNEFRVQQIKFIFIL